MITRRFCYGCFWMILAFGNPHISTRAVNAATDGRDEMLRKLDERAGQFGPLARRIWEFAQVGYKEKQSSHLLKSELPAARFRLPENVPENATAFVATPGRGRPINGIPGEFGALPGLSQ